MIRIALLTVLTLVLTSCQVFNRSLEVKSQRSIVLGFNEGKVNLDWQKEMNLPSILLVTNLMEGMVSYETDGTQFKIVPSLAESWEQKNSGVDWIFKLRAGVNWSDGKPLTSVHFLNSLKRLLAPETLSPYADVLFSVKGAREYHSGKIKNFDEVGIKSVDPKTIVFHLIAPNSHFLESLAHFSTFPMRDEHLELFNGKVKKVEAIPWIGVFKISIWGKRKIQVVENKKYRLPGGMLDKVDFLIDVKKEKLSKLLKDHKADGVFNSEQSKLKNTKTYISPAFEYFQLTFDCLQKPFTNPILRRVIALSINKEELSKLIPNTEPLGGVIPPGISGYESNRGMRFDPEMAGLVLKNANMTHDLKKFDYDLYVSPTPVLLQVAAVLKDQLKRNLDMDIKIVQSPFDPATKRPSLILERLQGRSMNPLYYLGQFEKLSDRNRSGWKSRAYEDFLKKPLLARAQHLLVEEEIPVIPLFSTHNTLLASNQVKGVRQNFMKYVDLKEVAIEKR